MLGRRFTTCLALVLLLAACQRQGSEPAASGVKVEVINGVTTYTNRLITEKSPYLQRHAHNPVDWYPWGQDAFDRARRENKPIFLSIGYSTCHWCHVMEEESFSNPTIAALMNASFVSIKVDREEHPDVDRVYLAYVTSVNGGGWPMSLFLTPDLKPFFGATYMPPDTRGREEGFRSVLQRVAAQWASSRDVLIVAANEGSTTVMAQARIPKASDDVESTSVAALDGTFDAIARSFDGVNGGFGGAPKFPRPVVMTFLLRHFARTGEVRARDMALDTLRAMARSAIHDHLGGGFHRYTVDAAWQIPHFEKMLYDQALVSMAYTEAYQLTRDEALASTARDTLDYVRQTLRSPAGGFYSAEDADSLTSASDARLAEGAFYVWTPQELTRALGSSQAALVAYHFGVTDEGNLAVPGASADSLGKSALGERHTLRETAAQFRLTEPAARARLDDALGALARVRATRPRPARDDKIIAAWNGLMISAFARAGQAFDNRADVDAAVSAARFIESRMYDAATGTLKRRARQDAVDLDGLLEDYAFVIQGCLDVFEASFDPRWLRLASRLQQTQDTLFWDQKDGGYFSTRAGAAHLLARMKEDYDGPEPAANSVSALNLVRLWQLTSVDLWRARADATFTALSGRIARSGSAVPQLMSALDFRRSTTKEIVIAGTPGAPDTAALLRLVHDRFLPNKVLALADGGRGQVDLAEVVPFVEAMNMRDGKATIYVCENYVCRLPTNDLAVAARLLDSRAATRRP